MQINIPQKTKQIQADLPSFNVVNERVASSDFYIDEFDLITEKIDKILYIVRFRWQDSAQRLT